MVPGGARPGELHADKAYDQPALRRRAAAHRRADRPHGERKAEHFLAFLQLGDAIIRLTKLRKLTTEDTR
ncbi:hypothetical protein SD37_10090 [Amycolatopsis orientalis]|uniref:Transposase n=1 Tax=Amycolatopsis orientalis TaxID=31958 RepID=A0A193BUV1_AMYOR|nr:hypothetical protein SD37_10090 [Amycolatopsis orientalis]